MNELGSIAARAAALGLPLLLGGGHAVIAHGVPRSTFDLDLMVRQDDRAKWLVLARELGYDLHREGPTFLQFSPANPQAFPLDLMLVNEETFSKLQAEAVVAPFNLGEVKVVSLLHLLALKCHAIKHGHPGRIVRDADDVIRLIQNNKLDAERQALRQLILKHGTQELYEKVRRACQQQP